MRRHAAEGILLAGGGAAILLQLADPRVAAGVARHSDFAGRPLDRLVGTLDYLYAIVFGDAEIVRAAARRVNRAHAPVRSAEGDAAPAYRAFDVDAQRWVAATLFAVAIDLEGRVIRPLDAPGRAALLAGYAALGTRLQMPAEDWPDSPAAFDAYWAERLASLEVTDEARHVARSLLFPTALPAPLASGLMPLVRLVTAGLLPPKIRDDYGIRWTPRAQRAFDGWMRTLRILQRITPAWIRHAPVHGSLRRWRARLR
nr:oxygenase MpaB family protein [Agromyces seonyuensis]